MGGFYGSVQVRAVERGRVKEAAERVAREVGIRCLVGPVLNGWVGVYPENGGQDDKVGARLAEVLGGDVLQVMVHDDSVMAYWLWRGGKLADSYWSRPGYFGEGERKAQEAMAGNAMALEAVGLLKTGAMAKLLECGDDYPIEVERLERFGKLMGIRNLVLSYEYFKEGEERVVGRKGFEEVPAEVVEAEKMQRRAGRRRVSEAKKASRAEGLLLADVTKKGAMPRTCIAGDGLLVVWQEYHETRAKAGWYRNGVLEEMEFDGPVNAVVADAEGGRVAMAIGKRVVVYTVEGWVKVLEVEEKDWAFGVALSSDGKLLVHVSRQEVVVTEVEGGRRVWAENGNVREIAFHPLRPWVVLAAENSPVKFVSIDGPERRGVVWVGGRQQVPGFLREAVKRQMARINPEIMRKEQEKHMETGLARFERSVGKREGITAEQMEKMREEMRKGLDRHLEQLRALAAGMPEAELGAESVMCAGVSRDGNWVWFGTSEGVRVYEWEKAAAGEGEVKPTWRYDSRTGGRMIVGSEGFGHIYVIVEEPDEGAILFAGIDGRIRRMDLRTGEANVVFVHPDGAAITNMAIARGRREIALSTTAGLSEIMTRKRQNLAGWEVWSYERLRERAVREVGE